MINVRPKLLSVPCSTIWPGRNGSGRAAGPWPERTTQSSEWTPTIGRSQCMAWMQSREMSYSSRSPPLLVWAKTDKGPNLSWPHQTSSVPKP